MEIRIKKKHIDKKYKKYIEESNLSGILESGRAYYDNNYYDAAIEAWTLGTEKGDQRSANNLGILYYNKLDYENAKKYLSLAAEQNYREAYNNLGCLFFELNMFADSQTYYQKAIDAGDIEAYSNLGLLHYKNNEFDKAEQMYLKAIDLGSAKALFNLAVLYHNQKRYNEAELNYLKAIKKIRQAQTFFLELLRDGGDTVAICLPIVFLAQLYFGGLKQETKAIELLKANSWPKDKIELFLNF